jgi:glucose dehydrogenase
MKRLIPGVAAIGVLLSVGVSAQSGNEWPSVAGDPGATEVLAVTEITPANVSRLKEAWRYDSAGPRPSSSTTRCTS